MNPLLVRISRITKVSYGFWVLLGMNSGHFWEVGNIIRGCLAREKTFRTFSRFPNTFFGECFQPCPRGCARHESDCVQVPPPTCPRCAVRLVARRHPPALRGLQAQILRCVFLLYRPAPSNAHTDTTPVRFCQELNAIRASQESIHFLGLTFCTNGKGDAGSINLSLPAVFDECRVASPAK